MPETPEAAPSPLIETSQLLDCLTTIAYPKHPGAPQTWVTDSHGNTYSGPPSHIVLLVMLRRDLMTTISASPYIGSRVRHAAHLILLWFTNEHTPREHAEVFNTLTAQETCRMVAAMVNRHTADTTHRVGPQSLPLYTAHLLAIAGQPVTGAASPTWPQVVDPDASGALGWSGEPDVTVTTRDGSPTVRLHVELTATEELVWRLRTDVDIPANDLNDVLRYAGTDLSAYLTHNPDLIEDKLHLPAAEQKSLHVQAELLPADQDPETGKEPGEQSTKTAAAVTLYFVGRDHDHALSRPAHRRIEDAEADAEADAEGSYEGSYDVFRATVEITTDLLVQVTHNR